MTVIKRMIHLVLLVRVNASVRLTAEAILASVLPPAFGAAVSVDDEVIIDLKLTEAIKDVSPYAILSAAIVCATYAITLNIGNIYARLILKATCVSICYCAMLWMLRSTIFKEIILFVTKKEIK